MAHSHAHHADDHAHAPIEDADGPSSDSVVLEQALRELLIEKGVFTAADIRREIDDLESRGEAQGARLVARAWVDPGFKERLLDDVAAAAAEIGIDLSGYALTRALENTEHTHHLVVCTLCSCYPRGLLGPPPLWYKSRPYRSRTVSEPRAVLAEFGTALPDDVAVEVVDSTADLRYLVVPRRPAGTEGMDEEALARLVTRDSMIGVAHPRPA